MDNEKTKHEHIAIAIMHMKQARDHLHQAGVNKATTTVRRALKSVEGAQRHAMKPAAK